MVDNIRGLIMQPRARTIEELGIIIEELRQHYLGQAEEFKGKEPYLSNLFETTASYLDGTYTEKVPKIGKTIDDLSNLLDRKNSGPHKYDHVVKDIRRTVLPILRELATISPNIVLSGGNKSNPQISRFYQPSPTSYQIQKDECFLAYLYCSPEARARFKLPMDINTTDKRLKMQRQKNDDIKIIFKDEKGAIKEVMIPKKDCEDFAKLGRARGLTMEYYENYFNNSKKHSGKR